MIRRYARKSLLLHLLLISSSCGSETNPSSEITINEQGTLYLNALLTKSWSFTYDVPEGAVLAPSRPHEGPSEPRRQAPDCGGGEAVYKIRRDSIHPSSFVIFDLGVLRYLAEDGRQYAGIAAAKTNLPDRNDFGNGYVGRSPTLVMLSEPDSNGDKYFYYAPVTSTESGNPSVAITRSPDLINWLPRTTSSINHYPWSLTAALTPGDHHVRLYLETEGVIETMLSKIDNFTEFQNGDVGPVRFLDRLTGSPIHGITPRDPNVTRNDLGVYAMTWDNRLPQVGPGMKGVLVDGIRYSDSSLLSPTFGLAFSVDGLEWTVYSNEMRIENIPPETCGEPYDYHATQVSLCTSFTSLVRHVVPVFITNEQIRLYFTQGVYRPYSQSGSVSLACSTGTAISN